MTAFKSKPENTILDPNAMAPLSDGWEYTAIPLLDSTATLSDGVTPICAQLTYAGARVALARHGLVMLDVDDLEHLHAEADAGRAIELPAFTGTPTAEVTLEHRRVSDEANRKAMLAAGWKPGARVCNFGKGWVAGAPAGRAWLMGWWVKRLAAYSPTRVGPGFIQPRPVPGSNGAHGESDQADDGTNTWGKRRVAATVGSAPPGDAGSSPARGSGPAGPSGEVAGGAAAPLPVLRLGSRGLEVERWQKIVGATVTGDFDEGTKLRTIVWQGANKLQQDGIVGPKSWAAGLAEERVARLEIAVDDTDPAPALPSAVTRAPLPLAPFRQARHYYAGRKEGPPIWVIVHTAETFEATNSAEVLQGYAATMPDGRRASWHYSIDNDTICPSVREEHTSFAAPNANARGIQIELAGRARQTAGEWDDAFSRAQLSLLARLVADICTRWKIPAVKLTPQEMIAGRSGIAGHYDVTRGVGKGKTTHVDPGPSFPWDKLIAAVVEIIR